MAGVRIYKAPDGSYVGVNPLAISTLPPGTMFTLIRPPDADSDFEPEHQWRRQRWCVVSDPTPEPHLAFVLEDEVVLTVDEAAYFEALD